MNQEILDRYYANGGEKLRKLVDKFLRKFGGLSDKDRDEFYSLANIVFFDVIRKYDGKRPFEPFLASCLSRKIKSEMTKRNCEKRKLNIMAMSIDMPLPTSDGQNTMTVEDMVADCKTVEGEIFEDREKDKYSVKMQNYLKRLSKMQKNVLKLLAEGYSANEIIEELNISQEQYDDCNKAIHSDRNTTIIA